MSTRAALATIASLVFGTLALAQQEPPPEPGQIGLSLTGRASGSGEGKFKSGSITHDHVQIGDVDFTVAQVVHLDQTNSLRFSLDHHYTNIDQNRDPGDPVVPLPKELASLTGGVAYTRIINPRWIITGRVSAGSHVSDASVLSGGWAVSTMAMAIYNHSQSLTYIFGMGYSSNLDDLRILPIFGLNWRPAPKWSVAFGFPRTAITYNLNKDLALGLAFSGAGGAYYVKNDPRPGAAPNSLADARLQRREFRLGFDVSWKINKAFRISGAAGRVLHQKFKYTDRNFELKSSDCVPFLSAAGTVSF